MVCSHTVTESWQPYPMGLFLITDWMMQTFGIGRAQNVPPVCQSGHMAPGIARHQRETSTQRALTHFQELHGPCFYNLEVLQTHSCHIPVLDGENQALGWVT